MTRMGWTDCAPAPNDRQNRFGGLKHEEHMPCLARKTSPLSAQLVSIPMPIGNQTEHIHDAIRRGPGGKEYVLTYVYRQLKRRRRLRSVIGNHPRMTLNSRRTFGPEENIFWVGHQNEVPPPNMNCCGMSYLPCVIGTE